MAITLTPSQLDMLRHQVRTIGLLAGLELLPFLEQLAQRELDVQAWTAGAVAPTVTLPSLAIR